MSAICDAHKKKVDVELLCNSVHRKFNQLETRCGIESQHLAEGALRPPIEQLGSDELEPFDCVHIYLNAVKRFQVL